MAPLVYRPVDYDALELPEACSDPSLPDEIFDLFIPDKKISSLEWFEENIKIPERFSDFSGAYSRNTFPYQCGVFEAFDDIEVREIYLQWATQTGKSTIIQSMPCRIAMTDPAPIMFVCPDDESAKEMSNERITKVADLIPELFERMLPEGRRDAFKIDLGSCVVYMASSYSPSAMGQRSCKYVFGTEISKWTHEKSMEADAADLVRERVKAFWSSKIIFEGTPTLAGACRMEQLAGQANQRMVYYVPCPFCGKRIIFNFDFVIFEKKEDGHADQDLAFKTARYHCEHCDKDIYDHQKIPMIRAGIWAEHGIEIPESFKGFIYWTPGKDRRRVHFHLNSIYSPVLTFGDIAGEFIRAIRNEGKRSLQNFVNSWLAESFKKNIKEYNWEALRKKIAVDKPSKIIPSWAYFLTGGIDIGTITSYWTIRAWGAGGKSQLINWGQVAYRDSNIAWEEIEALTLMQSYPMEGKKEQQRVTLIGIDSGFKSYEVYTWSNAMNEKYGECVRPIKGRVGGAPYFAVSLTRSGQDGKNIIDGGVQLWHLNDPHWKEFVYSRYAVPVTSEGAWLIPNDTDDVYMRSITAEVLQERVDKKGFKKYEWILVDKAIGNHYFDCEKIAAAIADMCGWKEIDEEFKNRDIVAKENNRPRTYSGAEGAAGRVTSGYSTGFLHGSDDYWGGR